MYEEYKEDGDFVGMDMARKFLQMGYTRARRYANHAGGKKYDGPVPADKKGQSGAHGRAELPRTEQPDPDKAEAAAIFKAKWDEVKADPDYRRMRRSSRRGTCQSSSLHIQNLTLVLDTHSPLLPLSPTPPPTVGADCKTENGNTETEEEKETPGGGTVLTYFLFHSFCPVFSVWSIAASSASLC